MPCECDGLLVRFILLLMSPFFQLKFIYEYTEVRINERSYLGYIAVYQL